MESRKQWGARAGAGWIVAVALAVTLPWFAEPTSAAEATESTAERAQRLARELVIVDTHIDVPYRLIEDPEDVALATRRGDFDAPRARSGGLDVLFQSIYVPSGYQKGGAKLFADGLIDLVETIAEKNPEVFAMARSTAEVEANRRAGKISFAMGMENGAPIESDLANVAHFARRGIRYITLTHGENNQISDSSYAPPDQRTWNGLSPFGREVVAEMNRQGILVDLSHVSDAAFDQAVELTAAAPIASHSSCRHFTPGFERNLDDSRIQKLAAKGGVIQINFGSSFLTAAANAYSLAEWQAGTAFETANPAAGRAEIAAFHSDYRRRSPYPFATLDDVVAHIDHVAKLVGIEHVGLGSDFDGVGDSLPVGLKSVADYPNLVAKLLERGYSEADVAKVLGGNLLRVWKQAEEVSRRLLASPATS